MRKRLSFKRSHNMLGHTCHISTGDHKFVLVENQEQDFLKKNKSIQEQYYWFRAPRITLDQLRTTAENLIHLEDRFKLEIWATLKDDNQDPMFDASLKIADQIDAATFVWGHTEMWMKWDDAQEKDLKQQIKASNKPLRAKVTKDGRVRVKVTVTSLED